MQADFPLVRDLVLVGGGHAHVLVLRKWAMNPQPGVQVTLINPAPVAAYTGMLPGVVAGHFARDEAVIDLVRLCRFAGARLILGAVAAIDRSARLIHVPGRPALRYDIASLDVGVLAGPLAVDGAANAVPARPLDTFLSGWQAHLARGLPDNRIVVVGGGVGGAELALAMAYRLQGQGARITIIDGGKVASALAPRAAALLRKALINNGISLQEGVAVAAISAGAVQSADGTEYPSDLTIAVAGARPHDWLQGTDLALSNGFVVVNPALQTSDPHIFAAGDCAELTHAPRPKAGVFAVRAAAVLHDNLRAALAGKPLRPFNPQRDYLKLISLGHKSALVERNGISFSHPALWRWKEKIDSAFMEKLSDFNAMPTPPVPADAAIGLSVALAARPLCGGCGAKVGAQGLRAALAALPAPQRQDVHSGPGDDAAILLINNGFQVMTTDHLRSFTHDPYVMARIAATHALGDIWAMGASPQVALAQITLPRMADPMQAALLGDLMAGATEVFGAAGADVVGGHTSVGAELTVGFTVTGLAPRIITKGGAAPGDRLILTKPLGSGTIMAAEMARARVPGVVLGEVVALALVQMQRSLGPASAILSSVANAMTDVTGFGLAGHLAEMLQASGCAARLDLGAVPLMPGALALAKAGQASSLAPANRAALLGILADDPRAEMALLIDPQTAGGLLAAVPDHQAEGVLQALQAAGEVAAIIGVIEVGVPTISVV